MVATVIRYRCDICGRTHLMESQAAFCETYCAEVEALAIESHAQAIEALRAETGTGSVEDESAVGATDAPKE